MDIIVYWAVCFKTERLSKHNHLLSWWLQSRSCSRKILWRLL